MPYNFVANSIHRKKLCSRLSLSEVQFYTENGRFAFLSPPRGLLGVTYDVHAHKKAQSGLSVSVNSIFSLYTAQAHERISIENRRFRFNRVSLAQNFR